MIHGTYAICSFLFFDLLVFIYLYYTEEFKVVFSLFWKFTVLGIICLFYPYLNLVLFLYPARAVVVIRSEPYNYCIVCFEVYVMLEFFYILLMCYTSPCFFSYIPMVEGHLVVVVIVLIKAPELLSLFITYMFLLLLDYYNLRKWYVRKYNGLLAFFYDPRIMSMTKQEQDSMSKEDKDRIFKKW